MEELAIRKGTEADAPALGALYDALNDYLAATTNYPGWKKGIYPVRQDAEDGIAEGSLFVAEQGGEPVGSIILRHRPEEAYAKATWQKSLEDSRVLVIYTFVVAPGKHRGGVGKKLLDFAEQYARANGAEALRLDVYEKNTPAMRLYEKCGFVYIDTVSLGLEEAGLDWFHLYEKLL